MTIRPVGHGFDPKAGTWISVKPPKMGVPGVWQKDGYEYEGAHPPGYCNLGCCR